MEQAILEIGVAGNSPCMSMEPEKRCGVGAVEWVERRCRMRCSSGVSLRVGRFFRSREESALVMNVRP